MSSRLDPVVVSAMPAGRTAWAISCYGVPPLQLVLLLLMVVGGSAGSTSGGAKIFRIQVAFNYSGSKCEEASSPVQHRAGQAWSGTSADPTIVHRIIGFLTTFLAITLLGTLLITATGAPFKEIDQRRAIVGHVEHGPGVGRGRTNVELLVLRVAPLPVWCSLFSMLIGRLELFAVLLMFSTPAASFRKLLSKR